MSNNTQEDKINDQAKSAEFSSMMTLEVSIEKAVSKPVCFKAYSVL